jgi:hypothetical protein
MKKLLIAILLMFAVPVYAANTIDVSNDGMTITISAIDTDWTWTDNFTATKYANGIRVNYIRFHPGATDDICSLEDSDNGDLKHFLVQCADVYDDRIQYYYGSKLKLVLDFDDTDSTWTAAYTTGCSLTIQLWPTQEP